MVRAERSEVASSMASSSAERSTGLTRWKANPADRLIWISSDEPKPDRAIPGTGRVGAKLLDQLQPGAVGQLDVADEQVNAPRRRSPGGPRSTPSAVRTSCPRWVRIVAR